MLNKVILMGRLTADPEVRQSASGVSVARFSLAVNRNYQPKDGGERQADFINIVAFRNTADFVGRYFIKGQQVIVEGALRQDNYTDKDGNKRYSYNVAADQVYFADSKNSAGNNGGGTYQQQPYQQSNQFPVPERAPAPAPSNFTEPANNSSFSIGDFGEYEEIATDEDLPF